MDLEQAYIEYIIQFSLSLLAVSAAYFIDPSRAHTFAYLLLLPVLFGFTAYASRDGFRKSSLLCSVTLLFSMLNPIVAGVAIVLVIGNVLVSVFASGNSFKSFYGSTALPLLFAGIILGLATYGAAISQPEFGNKIVDRGSEFMGEKAETMVEGSNIIESQKEAQISAMEGTSEAAVMATRAYVLNETRGQLDPEQKAAVNEAFRNAREDVPRQMTEQVRSQAENATVDVSKRTEDMADSLIGGKAFILLIPLIAFTIYSLQPLVGLLTAISATFFRFLSDA